MNLRRSQVLVAEGLKNCKMGMRTACERNHRVILKIAECGLRL